MLYYLCSSTDYKLGIGKLLQGSFNLDVTFMLLNMTEGLMNSTGLLEHSI